MDIPCYSRGASVLFKRIRWKIMTEVQNQHVKYSFQDLLIVISDGKTVAKYFLNPLPQSLHDSSSIQYKTIPPPQKKKKKKKRKEKKTPTKTNKQQKQQKNKSNKKKTTTPPTKQQIIFCSNFYFKRGFLTQY